MDAEKPGYKVQKNDNLSSIARKAGVTVAMILALKGNERFRKNPNDLRLGQVINMPSSPSSASINNKFFKFQFVHSTPGLDFMGGGTSQLAQVCTSCHSNKVLPSIVCWRQAPAWLPAVTKPQSE